jgi:long-subunit fatty acid transport protein
MMVNPSGIGSITATADDYATETMENISVYGGSVTWVEIRMKSGLPEPHLQPGANDLTTNDGGGGYCFIATAAYGSPLGKQVQVLREFRDTYLLPYRMGRGMVDLYYQYGKGLAGTIEAHQWVKPFARVLLYPAIGMAWLSLSTRAAEKVAVAGLVLAALLMAAGRRFGGEPSVRSGLGPRGLCLLFVAALTVWCLTSTGPVHASTIFKQVGIASSPNPVGSGARAMGMGGAFIAIADDATASSWNPGGLVQVEKPEISVVGAYINRQENITSSVFPDVNSDSTVDGASLNYLSITYPFHLLTNMVVSLNYQRLYDFNRELDYIQDFQDVGLDLVQHKQYSQDGYLSALGIAGAVEILPRFSLGATFNLWTDQLFWRNGWEETFVERGVGTVADKAITIDTHIRDKYEEFRGINFNVGLLWNPTHFLTVGAVVKTPFTASVRHEFRFGQVQTFDDPDEEPITTEQSITEHVDLKMPISYGIGIAGRISDALSLDLDVYRTHWSDYILVDSQGNKFSPIDGRPEDESDVKDTTMVRLGAEYLFIMEQKELVVPVRGGFFYDPEPAHGSVKDFFGVAVGSGVAYKWIVFDLAYQLRWGTNVDTGNLIATTQGDIMQHNLLFSLILHL